MMIPKLKPSSELQAAVGAAFREARVEALVTLREIADEIGCSINTIRWHEAGTRTLYAEQLLKAADCIGTSVETLCGRKAGPVSMAQLAAEVGCLRTEQLVKVTDYLERLVRRPPVREAAE